MKQIYQKIWDKALPYYKKGRPMDIKHVQWMMNDAVLVCRKEDIDDSLLLPLVILHDVGYSRKNESLDKDPFNQDLKRMHMLVGAKIAEKILTQLSYPAEKIKKIIYYISVHDNWNLGDSEPFINSQLLAVFNDLDFMWLVVKDGFDGVGELIHKTPEEMIKFIENNEKLVKRPLATQTTKELYDKYLEQRKKENNIL